MNFRVTIRVNAAVVNNVAAESDTFAAVIGGDEGAGIVSSGGFGN